jgi:hypothetical protein
MATLPATPGLRRQEIRLQVALITPLLHIKGYAAPETQAATERARVLIEQAEAASTSPTAARHVCRPSPLSVGFHIANMPSGAAYPQRLSTVRLHGRQQDFEGFARAERRSLTALC